MSKLHQNSCDEKRRITLYDLLGKDLINFERQLDNGNISIDLSNLKTGIYFIKINSDEISTIKKIIKN
jgi:hypothetical protein